LSQPFVDSIVANHDQLGNEVRPGQWVVTYNDNSVVGAAQRVVRWPVYEAGHMVATDQPQQLFEDVGAFLRERRVIR
jgi:carboxypeptidase C (cathepsin A)